MSTRDGTTLLILVSPAHLKVVQQVLSHGIRSTNHNLRHILRGQRENEEEKLIVFTWWQRLIDLKISRPGFTTLVTTTVYFFVFHCVTPQLLQNPEPIKAVPRSSKSSYAAFKHLPQKPFKVNVSLNSPDKPARSAFSHGHS